MNSVNKRKYVLVVTLRGMAKGMEKLAVWKQNLKRDVSCTAPTVSNNFKLNGICFLEKETRRARNLLEPLTIISLTCVHIMEEMLCGGKCSDAVHAATGHRSSQGHAASGKKQVRDDALRKLRVETFGRSRERSRRVDKQRPSMRNTSRLS